MVCVSDAFPRRRVHTEQITRKSGSLEQGTATIRTVGRRRMGKIIPSPMTKCALSISLHENTLSLPYLKPFEIKKESVSQSVTYVGENHFLIAMKINIHVLFPF